MDTATTQPAELKFYRATAQQRSPAPGQKAEETVFVIAAPDYKNAWVSARAVTRFGTAHLDEKIGDVWTETDRKHKADVKPGIFTIKTLESLQERKSKKAPVTIGDLRTACEAQGVKIPTKLAELMTELEEKGPLPNEPALETPASPDAQAA